MTFSWRGPTSLGLPKSWSLTSQAPVAVANPSCDSMKSMELDVLAFVQTVNYNEFVVRVSSSLRRLEAAPSVVVVVLLLLLLSLLLLLLLHWA